MSPGPTFERVYLELKRQLREGTRLPGSPLEPAVIGDELGTSFTPVRDALHRLVGEGLVENPQHNGFAVPRPTEQALRDLYGWAGEVVGLAAARMRAPLASGPDRAVGEDATEALFLSIADATGNREHARTMRRLTTRLAPYRRVEARHFADIESERDALTALVRTNAGAPLGRALARYHRRRVAATPEILALLLENRSR
jgi:DNA-binding FadR family transcriptional regulator